jgi:formylmethanofuran dehydrogenase subunit E
MKRKRDSQNSRAPRWTLGRFLESAKSIHGEKYDYSLITAFDILGNRSRVSISCRKCSHQWQTTLKAHINQKTGCSKCAGKCKWSYDTFMKAAKEKHGEKFDYTLILPSDITNSQSKIRLLCRKSKCSHAQEPWETKVRVHLRGSGCPACAGKQLFTFDTFLERAKAIHGTTVDYSEIIPSQIKGTKSRILLKCTNQECYHYKTPWISTVLQHIKYPTGCPICTKGTKWTYQRFLQKAKKLHGDKINYEHVRQADVQDHKSNILLQCNRCEYIWKTSIGSHIHGKSGCPRCVKQDKWTYSRFLEVTTKLQESKVDYSQVTEYMVKNKASIIPLTCKTCEKKWNTSIRSHFIYRTGCPRCARCEQWTFKRFIEAAKKVHGNLFDYSNIDEKDVLNCETRISVRCVKCNESWFVTITNHINNATRCPHCRTSKGEHACKLYFQSSKFNFNHNFDFKPKRECHMILCSR